MKNSVINKISGSTRIALRYVLVSLLAYFGAYYLTDTIRHVSTKFAIGALWAVIVGVVVIQATWISTVEKARFQILGGLVGAILSLVYLEILPFNPVWMALLIGLAAFLFHSLNRPDYAVPAALTVAVILIFSYLNPELSPLMNAGLRFSEIIIGSAIAILIVGLLPYARDQTV